MATIKQPKNPKQVFKAPKVPSVKTKKEKIHVDQIKPLFKGK